MLSLCLYYPNSATSSAVLYLFCCTLFRPISLHCHGNEQQSKNFHDVLGTFVEDTSSLQKIAREEHMLFWGLPVISIFCPTQRPIQSFEVFLRSGRDRLWDLLQREGYELETSSPEQRKHIFFHGKNKIQVHVVQDQEMDFLGLTSLESYVLATTMTTYGQHFMTWRHAVCVCPMLLDAKTSIALKIILKHGRPGPSISISEVKFAHQQGYRLPTAEGGAWENDEVCRERTLGDQYSRVVPVDGDTVPDAQDVSFDTTWKFSLVERVRHDAFRILRDGREQIIVPAV
ncbi:uncharacterized protein PG998_014822 [Apiospora kogelbergensis]|uniref:uncharacterized protein n=1 Tax=Apiospora kogelbergensis TaxID=1337665 RepID=UPI00312FF469